MKAKVISDRDPFHIAVGAENGDVFLTSAGVPLEK